MKIENVTKNTFVTSNSCEKVGFGIDSEDLPHLIGLLRNDIYTDKELAVIREISVNAYDANVQAGKGMVPIKVSLPTKFSSQLKIRDFGNAMSFDQLKSVFVKYGKSTKRNSNSEVGCFGIGAKSPFAYTDSFIVVSYINGVKHIYNCVLGTNNVGDMLQIGESETTEPNGIEVIINIKTTDITIFRNKALEFYKYWDVKPDIEGFTAEDYKNYFNNDILLMTGTNWSLFKSEHRHTIYSSIAVMGNISYTINYNKIADFDEKLLELSKKHNISQWQLSTIIKQCKFVFKFNIGEISMTPSRESLQYITLTNNAIINRIELLLTEITDVLNKKLDTASNIFVAKQMYSEINENMPYENMFDGFNLTYKGININNNYFNFSNYTQMITLFAKNGPASSYYRRRRQYSNIIKSHRTERLVCDKNTIIIEIDQEKKCYLKKAAEYYSNLGYTNIYVLNFPTPEDRTKVFNDLGLDDSFIIKYSTISDKIKITIVRNYNKVKVDNTNSERTLKYYSDVKYDYGYRNEISSLPTKSINMNDGGIYIEISDNCIVNGKTQNLNGIKNIINEIHRYMDKTIEVFFINQKLIKGTYMKSGKWIKFDDYVLKFVNDITSRNELIRYKFANFIVKKNSEFVLSVEFVKYLNTLENINSDLKLAANIYNLKFNGIVNTMNEYYTINDDDVMMLKGLESNILEKYPMIKIFNLAFTSPVGVYEENREIMAKYLS